MNKIYVSNDNESDLKNHIIFICDHASNNIFRKYQKLAPKKKILTSHIAYDIGAKDLTYEISSKLKQSFFMSNFSRLIIDPNRSKNDKDLIVSNSFDTKINMNKEIDNYEKNYRLNHIHEIYHENLKTLIQKKKKRFKKVFLIAIHSFTKKGKNFDRGVEVGLLWNKDIKLLVKIQRRLWENNIHVGRNFPYSGFSYNYTLDRHSNENSIESISIEIRNDLICNKKGIKKYTELFIPIFKGMLDE